MHLGARAVRMLEKLRRYNLLHDRVANRRAQSGATSAREARDQTPLEKLEDRLLLNGITIIGPSGAHKPGAEVEIQVHYDHDLSLAGLQPHPTGLLSAGFLLHFNDDQVDVLNRDAIALVPQLNNDGAGGPPMKDIRADAAGFTAGIPLDGDPYQGTLIATFTVELLRPTPGNVTFTPSLFFDDGRVNFLGGTELNPMVLDSDLEFMPTSINVLVFPTGTAPVADAGTSYSVNEGGTIMLSAAGSMDAEDDANLASYLWDMDGDGVFGETGNAAEAGDEVGVNPTFEANFDGPLTHTVYVRVEDSAGNRNKASATIQINNLPPTANAGAGYQVVEGLTVDLNASASTDPSPADTLIYLWDFDGDGIFGETGGAATRGDEIGATPTFDASGLSSGAVATIALEVSDGTATDTVTTTVSVLDPLEVDGDQTADEGDTVTVNGTFTDPNGDGTPAVVIDWGDGNITIGNASELIAPNGMLTGSHVYQDDGVYTVTITLDSTDGTQQVDTTLVTVNNVAPTIDPIGDVNIDLGGAVDLMAMFNDAGLLDTHTATIDWGDGSAMQPLTVMRNPAQQSAISATLLTQTPDGADLDPMNFWSPARLDVAQAAIDDLLVRFGDSLSAITPGTNDFFVPLFHNPNTGTTEFIFSLSSIPENELIIFLGSSDLGPATGGGFILAQASPGGFEVGGVQSFLDTASGRGQDGALIDDPIDFGSWGGSLFVTTNSGITFHDELTTDNLDAGETDLFTVLQHEFIHVLGGNGASESWDRFANGSFAGPASQLLFGGPVPLHGDGAHWQDGLMFDGAPVVGDPSIPGGQRVDLNALDIAGLDDVGWEVLPEFGAGGTLSGSHTFSAPGMFDVMVTLTDDDGGTTTETFTVNVAAPAELSIADQTTSEDSGIMQFTVLLSSASTSTVTVDVSTNPGSAMAGSDFTPLSNHPLTFDPGETQQTFTVDLTVDNVVEATEMFTVELSNAVGATIADGTAIGTIIDTETATIDLNVLGNTLVTEGDSGTTTVTFEVTLSSPVDTNVDVGLEILTGTATLGVDHSSLSVPSVTFTPGEQSQTFTVNIIGDTDIEPDETFEVRASTFSAPGRSLTFGDNVREITIQNDDFPQPPVADANGPYMIDEGDALLLDGSGSTDADNAIVKYEWDLDYDGNTFDVDVMVPTATTSVPWFLLQNMLSYDGPGTFAIALRVTDASDLTDIAETTVMVGNVAPTADAGGPYTVNEGGTVLLDGTASSDPAGSADPLIFEWDLDYDGNTFNVDSTEASPVFDASNIDGDTTRTVALRVTDDDTGVSLIDTATVTINNVAPVVDAGGDATVDEGVTFARSGSISDFGGDTFTATVDYGDGGGEQTLSVNGSSFELDHIYGDDGTFTVTVVVTDDDGDSGSDSFTVTVDNVAPTADAGGPYMVDEGGTVQLDGTASGDVAADLLTYEWDVDYDGATFNPTLTGAMPVFDASNIDGPASRTVALRVMDDDGGVSVISEAIVTINNVAPTADAGGPYSVPQDGSVQLTGAATDPAGAADTLSFAWDFDNNGSFETIGQTVTFDAAGLPLGDVTVVLQVTDGDGGIGTDTATITVVAPDNTAPVANDAMFDTDEDVTLANMLSATDDDNDDLTFTLVSNVAGDAGSVIVEPSGGFTYNPAQDFNGTASFTFQANDGHVDSNVATVTINVAPVNDDPVAVNDTATADEDGSVIIDVLDNDSDVDGDTLSFLGVGTATNGTVEVNADNTITYTPQADFFGTDSFSYAISDGNGGVGSASVMITVNPVNDAPVATDRFFSIDEDGVLSDLLTAMDAENDDLTFSLMNNVPIGAGTATVQPDGNFTYEPALNFNGSTSFTFQVNDGLLDSNIATVMIDVAPISDDPVGVDDMATTDEDIAVTIDVLANDTDADGDTLTVSFVDPAGNGTVEINPDNTITYTPNADFFGTDSFSYIVNDGNMGTGSATVMITVNPINDAPVGVNDTAIVDEDDTVTIDVVANDTDVDGDTLSVGSTSTPGNGTIELNPDGTITYTPNLNYFGTDSFSYSVEDGNGGVGSASVLITINPVADAPVAADDSYSTDEDTVLTVPAPGVLDNDDDVDGDTLTVDSFDATSAAGAAVSVNPDGGFTYDPTASSSLNALTADEPFEDTFTYTISDGNGGMDVATVTIAVTGVNDVPITQRDMAMVDEDSSVTIDVLANDSDPDGDTLTIIPFGIGDPDHGTAVDNGDGTVTYTPNPDYNGPDQFTYTVEDGNGGQVTEIVDVVVKPVNDLPVAQDDSAMTDEDVAVSIPVVANDMDIDGDLIFVSNISQGANGTVTINPDRESVTYTPNPDFNGTDTFAYTLGDGNGGFTSAMVMVTVEPVNDAPAAGDDTAVTDPDTPVIIDVLVNDSDVEGDTITIVSVGSTPNGDVAINPDQTLTYTPNAGFFGVDTFTYTVDDGNGGMTTAQVMVTVNAPPRVVSISDAGVVLESDFDSTNFAVFTVTLSSPTDEQVTVMLNTMNGTATAGADFVAVSGQVITFEPGGSLTQQVMVEISDDELVEGDETFTATISNPTGGATIGDATGSATIDDHEFAEVEFLQPAVEGVFPEQGGFGGFVVQLNTDGVLAVPIVVNVVDDRTGSATPGADYEDFGTRTVTFLPGDEHGQMLDVSFAVNDDDLLEGGEDIRVSLSVVSGPATGSDSVFETILDDERLEVNYGGIDITFNEQNGGNVIFLLDSANPLTRLDTFYSIEVVVIGGSADGDDDFIFVNGMTFTIPLGAGPGDEFTLPIDTIDDMLIEGDETIDLGLTNPVGPPEVSIGAQSTTQVRIIDNDAAQVAFSQAFSSVNEDAGTHNVDVTLVTEAGASLAAPITVELIDTGSFAPDVTVANPTFTFNPGAGNGASGSFVYTINDDMFFEGDESFTATLGIGTGAPPLVTVGAEDAHTVTVTDDETATVRFAIPPTSTVDEDAGTHTVDVVLETEPGVTLAIPVSVAFADVGTGTATSGDDYEPLGTPTLTFDTGAGDGDTRTLTLTLIDDQTAEGNERIFIEIDSLSTPFATIGTPALHVVTIDDDEPSTLTVTIDPTSISENGGTATATVTRNTVTTNSLSVVLISSDTGEATVPPTVLIPADESSATFTINAVDDAIIDGTQTVTITTQAAGHTDGVATIDVLDDDDPVAVNDSYSTDEDTILTVPAPGVLDNDDNIEGGTITVSFDLASDGGATISGNPDGSFSYDPTVSGLLNSLAAGEVFNDTFSYTIDDGNGGSDSATVTVVVTGVNDAPAAVDDEGFTTDEDTALSGGGLLDNDNDPDTGDSLSVVPGSGATTLGGSVTVNADGTFTYDPTGSSALNALQSPQSLVDTFTYTITDGNGGMDQATVSITVTGVNDAPVAADDDYSTDEDAVLIVSAPGLLDNDTDPDTVDAGALVVDSFDATSAAGAAVSVNPDGSFTYDPTGSSSLNALSADEPFEDTFTYTISDGNGGSDTATVTITVTGVNDAPVAVNDAATTDQNVPVVIDVLDNDTDADAGDTLSIDSVGPAGSGVVAINADNTLTYTPDVNFFGTDTFTYVVSDGNGGSDSANVTITVNEVVTPTISVTDAAAVTEGDSGTVNLVFDVSLSSDIAAPVSVRVDTQDGAAAAGSDYDAVSNLVLDFMPGGPMTQQVFVTVNGDNLVELNESLTLVLSNPTGGADLGDDVATGTILNDDAATISIGDLTVTEGDGGAQQAMLTVTLDAAVDAPVSVNFATANGTAGAGGDYNAGGGMVNFTGNAGETQTIIVNVFGDETVELDESFFVNLSNVSAGGRDVTLDDDQATVTITNDDDATFSIDDVTITEGDGGTQQATFTVTLNNAVDTSLSADFVTANGTATAGSDYVAGNGTLNFAGNAGETQTIDITINGDMIVELDETFTVNLSNVSAGGRNVTIDDGQGVGTITNDDDATISIDDVTMEEGDSGTTAFTFTVTLSHAVDTGVDVNFATANGSAGAGGDYNADSGTLSFTGNAGETRQVTVQVFGDIDEEPDEDFFVNLSNVAAAGRSVTIADAQGRGLIVNDDEPAVTPLAVDAIIVNDGSAQRSNIERLTVQFNQATNVQALIDNGDIIDAAQVVDDGGTPLALELSRFSYNAAANELAIDLTTDGPGGSAVTNLTDGRYQLRLNTALIHAMSDAGNPLVDGDGIGDGVHRFDFHRLAADIDGNGTATEAESRAGFLAAYRAVEGVHSNYNVIYDFDGDGYVSILDYLTWRNQIGKTV